jgi:hypothetical protein
MKKALFPVLMILVFTLAACVQRPGAIASPTPVTRAPELTQTPVPTPSQEPTWVPLPTIALTPGATHASLPTFALPNFPTPLTPIPTLDVSAYTFADAWPGNAGNRVFCYYLERRDTTRTRSFYQQIQTSPQDGTWRDLPSHRYTPNILSTCPGWRAGGMGGIHYHGSLLRRSGLCQAFCAPSRHTPSDRFPWVMLLHSRSPNPIVPG